MRAIGRVLGTIIRRSLAGWYKLPSHSQQAHHKSKSAPSSKSMSSARSSLKKSQCWLWLAVDSIFGKVLGFTCGRRTIKTGKVLWQQINHLPSCPSTPSKPTDGLWYGHAEELRKFHSTRQALCGKDFHYRNQITQLPTEAFSSKATS